MRFENFPVAQTNGMILAHSVRIGHRVLKKGHHITEQDVNALREAGQATIYAAALEKDDVPEDEAAAALATALAGANISTQPAFTGRANLYAKADGVFLLHETLIHTINAIDESITIATLKHLAAVRSGQMLATIKIIPFAVRKNILQKALDTVSQQKNPIALAPYVVKQADLILTTLSDDNPKLRAKAEKTVGNRLNALGITLSSVRYCQHDRQAIAATLGKTGSGSDLTLILGASATVDRADVVPAGVHDAGGEIIHFGMPVDPGNLLLLAQHNNQPLLGLPGCARSPKLNGVDWVLQRLAARIPVTPADIQAMGVGGLLKEIPSRPQPRSRATRRSASPRIAAIILAAGQSRRMGEINKLTSLVEGKPMVAHVADAALSSNADEIILVTGHEEKKILTSLAGRPLTQVSNENFAEGLSTSVRTGVSAAAKISPPVEAAIVLLGDMPFVDADVINQLISAHAPDDDAFICVPTVNGKRGNPVLWDAAFFSELQQLQGDIGAKHLIAEHEDLVREVPITTLAPLTDIDTPDMLHAHEKGL